MEAGEATALMRLLCWCKKMGHENTDKWDDFRWWVCPMYMLLGVVVGEVVVEGLKAAGCPLVQ